MTAAARDPLTSFIARSLRAEVSDVREEILLDTTELELDRITFTLDGERRSLVMKRLPPAHSVEVQLLPFLSRKTDRVPTVHARGIPPAAAAGWPWLLVEDLLEAPTACDDPIAIVRAKADAERAVARDGPALAALGVPRIARRGALAEWPEALVHGALGCASAVRAERGVVLRDWEHASLGCGLLDVVRLARDARAELRPLAAAYGEAVERVVSDEALDAAAELV